MKTNIRYNLNVKKIKNSFSFFITLTTLIIPSISRNIISTYLSYRVSYVPCIILRVFFEIYPFIFPIYPNYGNYITSVVGLLIPFILFLATKKSINEFEKTKRIAKINKKYWYIYIPLWIMIILLFILIPGFFKYQIIAVGSGSMEPKIEYGDAVIFERNIDINKLKVGDIIVFNNSKGESIIHRIYSIRKDGKIIINTKGDANKYLDPYDLTDKDIKGKVNMVIKYIGYPTLTFEQLLE